MLKTMMATHRTVREVLWQTQAEVHGAYEADMLQERWDSMHKAPWFLRANADLTVSAQAQRTAERELVAKLGIRGKQGSAELPDMWAIYSGVKQAEVNAVHNTARIRGEISAWGQLQSLSKEEPLSLSRLGDLIVQWEEAVHAAKAELEQVNPKRIPEP